MTGGVKFNLWGGCGKLLFIFEYCSSGDLQARVQQNVLVLYVQGFLQNELKPTS